MRIADVVVDLPCRRLLRDGEAVELQQRVFDLLLVLLAEPHALHTRSSLFARVWPGVIVEDANLSQAVWMLRGALGPTRRQWIRTIPKSGYMLEPPELPVVEVDAAPPAAAVGPPPGMASPGRVPACPAASAATSGSDAAGTPAPARRRQRAGFSGMRGRLAGTVAALGGVALLAWMLLAPGGNVREADVLGTTPVAVALIHVGEQADEESWPARLLQAWLHWKLTALPEVSVIEESHLAADAAVLSPRIVLLTSGTSSDGAGVHFVRARLDTREGPRQLELRGSEEEVPRLVDALSRQVLELLLPARAEEPWPALEIGADAARAYTRAWESYGERDMAAAVEGLQPLVEQAPGFGLARLQLSTALSRLGQARAAGEHMVQARTLLRPLGADSERMMQAQELSVQPGREAETAEALSSLAREYPQRLSLRLDQAWYLVRAGNPDAAARALEGVEWDRQTRALRTRWRLVQAEVAVARGDPDGVRENASRAEHLARQAGPGWERELAAALHMLARADVFSRGADADFARFEEAARLFSEAGAELDAMYVRVNAELARPGEGPPERLERLLVQTRAGGYRRMEAWLLRQSAFRHFALGELDAYRVRIAEAHAAAIAAGDEAMRHDIEMAIVQDDLLAARFDRALGRVRQLREDVGSADLQAWLDQFEAVILGLRGDYAGALSALGSTAARLRDEQRMPLPEATLARLACERASYLLPQGRLHQARESLEACGRYSQQPTMLRLPSLHAHADLLAGDEESALEAMKVLGALLGPVPDGMERWVGALNLGYLQVRAGQPAQARDRFRAVATALQDSGYYWLRAEAELGDAEAALALGRWAEARERAAAVRGYLRDPPWGLALRLERIDAVAALASGQRGRAVAGLDRLHASAHEHGDVMVQLELHTLMQRHGLEGGCDPVTHRAQVSTTGMHGAALDWLAPLPPAAGIEAEIAVAGIP